MNSKDEVYIPYYIVDGPNSVEDYLKQYNINDIKRSKHVKIYSPYYLESHHKVPVRVEVLVIPPGYFCQQIDILYKLKYESFVIPVASYTLRRMMLPTVSHTNRLYASSNYIYAIAIFQPLNTIDNKKSIIWVSEGFEQKARSCGGFKIITG